MRIWLQALRRRTARSERGQSLVEFAILLPLLLVILLGVADFGRVFQAGIVTESAARAAAEAAALDYLRNPPDPTKPTWNPTDYYGRLHRLAAESACKEARLLANTTYAGGVCSTWPAVAICIHDAGTGLGDPLCGSAASGFSTGTASCGGMTGGWTTVRDGQQHAYVEVRTCYRFTTLFNLNLSLPMGAGLSLGDIHLRKDAFFTVADY